MYSLPLRYFLVQTFSNSLQCLMCPVCAQLTLIFILWYLHLSVAFHDKYQSYKYEKYSRKICYVQCVQCALSVCVPLSYFLWFEVFFFAVCPVCALAQKYFAEWGLCWILSAVALSAETLQMYFLLFRFPNFLKQFRSALLWIDGTKKPFPMRINFSQNKEILL